MCGTTLRISTQPSFSTSSLSFIILCTGKFPPDSDDEDDGEDYADDDGDGDGNMSYPHLPHLPLASLLIKFMCVPSLVSSQKFENFKSFHPHPYALIIKHRSIEIDSNMN